VVESSSPAMVWMLNPSTIGPAYSSSATAVVILLGGGALSGSSPSSAMVALSGSLAGGVAALRLHWYQSRKALARSLQHVIFFS
jgi:hypothetical protein